jgi:outer membrane protein
MKESEDLNNRMQQFQLSFQENIETTRTEMFEPVIVKAKNAISIVAKENNFSYIFDLREGLIVYYDVNTINILPLVKQKLGIN